jgi:hypothetical protein
VTIDYEAQAAIHIEEAEQLEDAQEPEEVAS